MTIEITQGDGCISVTIHRPEAKNALNSECVQTLARLKGMLDGPTPPIAVVLRSRVPGYFCLGMDLEHLARTKAAPGRNADKFDYVRNYSDLLSSWQRFPCLTIAAVDGLAVGGGVDLAASCDLVIASEEASFSIAQIRNGVFPLTTSAVLIPQIGRRRFLNWALSGQYYSAKRAQRLGLVSHVVKSGEVDSFTQRMLDVVRNYDPAVLRLGIQAVRSTAASALDRLEQAGPLLGLNCEYWGDASRAL
jgi:enoyl-CoA hydratase/carnithine racemase